MGRLVGKIAFITGVASGMGRAAAKLFAAEGATVVGCDISPSAAERTVSEVRQAGGRMVSFGKVDLSSAADAQKWISDGISETGGIDILYNNAGNARFSMFSEFTQEDWSFTIRNELDLVFYTTRAAWPHLVALNTISPGPIRTPATAVMPQEIAKRVEDAILLRQWGECEDVAYCALYLASNEARWVTGADFVVDGGGTAGL